MNRAKYLPIALAISLCTTPVFADDHYNYFSMDSAHTPTVPEPVADTNEDSLSFQSYYQKPHHDDYARTGHDYYIYGGYVFSYHFNDKGTMTSSPLQGNVTLTISPQATLPNTFHGVEIGFGKQWGQHLDFQVAYIQHFEQTKKSTGTINTSTLPAPTTTKVSTKGIAINFLYIFNPSDSFQVGTKLGAIIQHYTFTASASNPSVPDSSPSDYTFQDQNTTEIDPTAGLEFTYSFTDEFAVRLIGTYVWHTESKISSGEVNALIGFSYIL